jgi:hypothetical protein
MIREEIKTVSSGYLMIVVLLVAQLVTGYAVFAALRVLSIGGLIAAILAFAIVLVFWAGLFMVHPNEAKVLQLFGK